MQPAAGTKAAPARTRVTGEEIIFVLSLDLFNRHVSELDDIGSQAHEREHDIQLRFGSGNGEFGTKSFNGLERI